VPTTLEVSEPRDVEVNPMSTHSYPVRVDATLEEQLSRWLWLVKWLLVIPHYIVLAFLWLAFGVLSLVALVAILVTGRYPRPVFDFNVGVLRWTWRVNYYAYGGLGTDQYPPFTLHDRPDYPARLAVDHPEKLSRGLVLVKWWLLAIPHYIVVGIFLGTGWYVVTTGDGTDVRNLGFGLIGLLVLIAGVALLFTGSYPRSLFDLVLGLNRWVLRVAAYVGLMTDIYPPFRLDMGGTDPGSTFLSRSQTADPSLISDGSATSTRPTSPGGAGSGAGGGWTAGRVVAVVLGSLLAITSLGLMAGGGVLRFADSALRDQTGHLMSSSVRVESDGYAVTSETVELHDGIAVASLPDQWLGSVKVEATSRTAGGAFVGIARSDDVAAYLDGVGHSVVRDPTAGPGDTPAYDVVAGRAPTADPGSLSIWASSAAGEGQQTITWEAEEGDWTLVVMNQDAVAPIAADVSIGATAPGLDELAVALLVSGLVVGLIAVVVLVAALRRPAQG
jgi:hypothetical protein